jgi:hypothetical protein
VRTTSACTPNLSPATAIAIRIALNRIAAYVAQTEPDRVVAHSGDVLAVDNYSVLHGHPRRTPEATCALLTRRVNLFRPALSVSGECRAFALLATHGL